MTHLNDNRKCYGVRKTVENLLRVNVTVEVKNQHSSLPPPTAGGFIWPALLPSSASTTYHYVTIQPQSMTTDLQSVTFLHLVVIVNLSYCQKNSTNTPKGNSDKCYLLLPKPSVLHRAPLLSRTIKTTLARQQRWTA